MSQSNIEVSMESARGLERRMTVRVSSLEIDRAVETRLREVGKTAKLKGFRPGKVPAKVVRQRYAGQVREEVLSDVIRRSYSQAISEQQLNPAGGPAIEPLSDGDDSHFSFRAVFEVYPEVTLGDVAKLGFDVPKVDIVDSDVDDMIEKLREQRAEWREVERASADGDRVVLDFEGKLDGESFEGGAGTRVPIVVGGGQVIDDFDKGIRGLGAGDDKTIKVRFPKDYGVADLAGKKAEFALHVHSVEERVLPDVDAEFMEAFGVAEGGLEAFRSDVTRNMERELAERLRATTKTNALDALHDANRIDVPKALVADEIRSLQAETLRRMGTDDPARAPGADVFMPIAERRVRLALLVQELIAAAKLEVDSDRVDERIAELASPYEDPEQAAQLYRSNRQLLSQIESAVLEDQVVEHLVASAKVSEKRQSFDEFMNQENA